MVKATLLSCLMLPLMLGACAKQSAPPVAKAESPLKPIATIQELMDGEVDPSADVIWDSTGTIIDAKGVHDMSPKNDEQWKEVRRKTITLIEATNLLMMDGRHVASVAFAGDATAKSLGSAEIEKRISENRQAFIGFAQALQQVGMDTLKAVDARDVDKMTELGGTMDEVCEDCHKTFWYPSK